MSYDQAIIDHYTPNQLLEAIQTATKKIGKASHTITVDDLAPVDEFHIGGRQATHHLLSQLNVSGDSHILDVGCGLGGAARFMATEYNSQITGIDLTQEFIEVGTVLNSWVGLDTKITLQQANALSMPFNKATFDGATMFHVGMNIEDKEALFSEIYRVMRPGAFLGVYDIMQVTTGTLAYPVPWATTHNLSKLATPAFYEQALGQVGFQVDVQTNRRDFALAFFEQVRTKTAAEGGPDPFGLHLLMQESTPIKIKNMVDNIIHGLIAPVEIIARK